MAERELTFEQVRDGVILALDSAYPDAHIRSEQTPQSVNDGDFNVVLHLQKPCKNTRFSDAI